MPDAPDPVEVTRARLAIVEAEIARLEGERDRLHRALLALTSEYNCHNTHNMSTTMHPIVQMEHSKGVKKTERTKRLLDACHEAGIPSLRSLAEMLREKFKTKTQQAHLSFAVGGLRPIDKKLTDWIRDNTKSKKYPKGFESTVENWPKLRE